VTGVGGGGFAMVSQGDVRGIHVGGVAIVGQAASPARTSAGSPS
jgi:hypothetical protein